MKKFVLVVLGVLFGVLPVQAKSYSTTTSKTNNDHRQLCPSGNRGYVHRVCVVDAVATSTAAVFNSTATVDDSNVFVSTQENLTGVIDSSESLGCMDIEASAPKGIYINQFGTAGITVQYECYQ